MLDQSLSLSSSFLLIFLIMSQKKKPSKTSPDNYFPFTNLTNNLSLQQQPLQQQHQYSTTQQLFTNHLTETEKHINPLNEIRYPAVYMDPLNET